MLRFKIVQATRALNGVALPKLICIQIELEVMGSNANENFIYLDQ